MLALLLVLAGGAAWAWYRGWLTPKAVEQWGTGLGLAAAALLAMRGHWLPAALLAGLAGLAAVRIRLAGRPAFAMDRDEACQILGVSRDATPDEIRAAHRRLIAQVHPDRGGTADLARRVNEARDRLLER